MKPLAAFPDPEPLIRAVLDVALDGEGCTIGVGVPPGWNPDTSPPHLEIAWDGTPVVAGTIARATIRLVARARATSTAKNLALKAQGHLLAHTGGGGISAIGPGVGVQPVSDDDTGAELAWFTVRATCRSRLLA